MKTLKDRIWERRRGVALILGFMVVYMICFTWLENRTGVPIHLLEIRADDYIPFCECFIIPYFMWFGYIAVTVVYFTLFQNNKQELVETGPDIGFWNDTVYCGIVCICQWTYASGDILSQEKIFLQRWYGCCTKQTPLPTSCRVFMCSIPWRAVWPF